jgi:predicted GNAT family acetyltransferase
MDIALPDVVHNAAENRFEIKLGDDVAMIEYMLHGRNITFTHTEVPPAYEGRGVGSHIARFALDYARDHEMKVNPLCPFVKLYIERHPEYKPLTWGY